MNKPVATAGFSKEVVNIHRRAWMCIYSSAALFLKEMLRAWVKCVNSWFISMVWGQGLVALLIVSKLLFPTRLIFFIFAPCPNHAFDSFVCLQLAFFSFVLLSLPKNTEQWGSHFVHPAQILSDFALQLIFLFFPAISCIWSFTVPASGSERMVLSHLLQMLCLVYELPSIYQYFHYNKHNSKSYLDIGAWKLPD